jgi:hypothetical protein
VMEWRGWGEREVWAEGRGMRVMGVMERGLLSHRK